MPKTISASEANGALQALIDGVAADPEDVIVEAAGRPRAVIMSFSAYEELAELRESRKRAEAMAKLRELEESIGDRNSDLSEEEVDALANRFVRETIDDMVNEGLLRFERDL